MEDKPLSRPLDDLLVQRAWVRRLALAIARDPNEAGDLEQEAWLAALRGGPSDPAKAQPWFRTVLRRLAGRRRRGEVRRTAREEAVARPEHDPAPGPADAVAAAEALRSVVDAVLALEEPARTTVLLRYFEGLTPPQIAARQGVPLETVRTRLRRALEGLRGRLDPQGGGDGRRLLAVLLPVILPPAGTVPWAAGTAGAATGSGGGAAWTGGGIMAAKKGAVAAALAAGLLLAGGGWWALRDGGGGAGAGTGRDRGFASGTGGRGEVGDGRHGDGADGNGSPETADAAGPDETSGGTVRGRVFDEEMRPVRGATVRLRWMEEGGLREVLARGDGEGRYRLAPPSGFAARARGIPVVEVEAAGRAPLVLAAYSGGRALLQASSGRDGEQDFLLVAASATRGRVMDDATGQPVGEARVVLWSDAAEHAFLRPWTGGDGVPPRVLAEARTGSDGSFLLTGLPARGYYATGGVRVAATAPGRPPVTANWELPRPGEVTELVLRMRGAAVVEGRVEEADGSPAAGVFVRVGQPGGWPQSAIPGEGRTFEAVTDGTGRYRIEGVAAGERRERLSVIAERREGDVIGWWPSRYVTVMATAGETVEAPFLRMPERRVLGARIAVVDGEAKPVPGAQVRVYSATYVTGADGTCLVLWSLNAPSRPMEAVVTGRGTTGRAAITFAAEPETFVVVMKAERTVAGTVVDAEGRPLAGIQVTAVGTEVSVEQAVAAERGDGEWPEDMRTLSSTASAEDGSVVLRGLAGDPCHVLAVEWRGGTAVVAAASPVTPGGEPFRIVLDVPPTFPVEGSVTDGETGRPFLQPFGVSLRSGDGWVWCDSYQPGRFRFRAVPAGTWTLQVGAAGRETFEETVVVADDGSVAPVAVTLQPDGSRTTGLTVRGRVRTAAGTPTAGRVLLLRPAGPVAMLQRECGAVLREDGSFTLAGVRAGPYTAEVLSGGSVAGPTAMVSAGNAVVEIVDGDPPPELALHVVVGGALLLHVGGDRGTTEANGLPGPGPARRWEVVDAGGAVVRGEALHRLGSRTEILPLAPGTYTARLLEGDEPLIQSSVVVRAGEESRVEW